MVEEKTLILKDESSEMFRNNRIIILYLLPPHHLIRFVLNFKT